MSRPRSRLDTVGLSLWLAVYVIATGNSAFWLRLYAALAPNRLADWLFLPVAFLMLTGLLWAIFSLLLWPWTVRWLGSLLLLTTAVAMVFTNGYGLGIDTLALQAALETDPREVGEWLRPSLALYLLWLLPPLWLLWHRRPRPLSGWREVGRRLAVLLVATLVFAGGTAAFYATTATVARNERRLPALLNPVNVLTSANALFWQSLRAPAGPLRAVGEDARTPTRSGKPLRLVIVVGESVRAQNVGLLGYARDTTPELATRDVLAFAADSCGTATAVSLPCMFLPVDRAHYRERDVLRHENLLDVLARAGVEVAWLDNNTGSKGLAARVGERRIEPGSSPACPDLGHCFDAALVDALPAPASGDQVVVLHQKGSHGPSYLAQVPADFRHFQPACASNQLQDCSQAEVIAAYDETIRYSDHVLAALIDRLAADHTHANALLYVSDHGESTGEHGVWLHGMPYRFAPAEQTRVPLLLWLSPAFVAARGLDPACLAARGSAAALSHDWLFHSVLGLLGVATSVRDPALDLSAGCVAG